MIKSADWLVENAAYTMNILKIGNIEEFKEFVKTNPKTLTKDNFKDGKERPLMMGLTCPLLTNAEGVKSTEETRTAADGSKVKITTELITFFSHLKMGIVQK
mgnify:CR=1 FL=1